MRAASQRRSRLPQRGRATPQRLRTAPQRRPATSSKWCATCCSAHRSLAGSETDWLAAIVARRALEPNHLWEDLGLRARAELTRLLERHFAPLAAKNTRNMRWKRFFYRTLCEDDGFVLCATPTCTGCGDFETCFGEETGESRLARIRRTVETCYFIVA